MLENWSEWYQWKKHFRQKTIINQNSYDFKKKSEIENIEIIM